MPHSIIATIQPFEAAFSFLLLYLAEHIYPQRLGQKGSKHDLINLLVGILNVVVVLGVGYYFQKMISFVNAAHFGLFNVIKMALFMQLTLQFVLIDLFMYWWHRINHHLTFLWRFHQFHHSDQQVNSTTALRFHSVELLLSYVARLVIFPLLGISIQAILIYSLLFFPVVILHHSNITISESLDLLFRKMIVTPRMHRIHHSRKPEETNSNYSSIFPWWDRLFKTYRKVPLGEIEFGLD